MNSTTAPEGFTHLKTTAKFGITTLLLLAASLAPAARTQYFIDDSIGDLSQGDLTTSTLTAEGFLKPPVKREMLSAIPTSVVWDVIDIDGTRYVATGHDGKLFKQSKNKVAELVHDFEEPALYALAKGKSESVLVAASPSGKIHRVTKKGEVSTFAETAAGTVWALLQTEKELIAATGSPAGLLKIDDKGTTTSLVALPDVLNVLDVKPLPKSKDLVIATQGPGFVVRVSPDGKRRVLLDPSQEEVRRLAVSEDGTIIAAINGMRSPGGKLLERMGDGARMEGGNKPRPESFLVRITPDGFAEEFWISPESPIHDIHLAKDGSIIVAAGSAGNLVRAYPDGRADRIGIANEELVTRLAEGSKGRILAGTGAEAALYEITPGETAQGIYDSRVYDAKEIAKFGRIYGIVEKAKGEITIQTRTGNTAKPDTSWAEWSAPIAFSGEVVSTSAAGRFFQYRLNLTPSKTDAQPAVDMVRVFYTEANRAPRVTAINVGGAGAPPSSRDGGSAGGPPPGAPTGRQNGAPGGPGAPGAAPAGMEVSWTAQDSNNDQLVFALDIKPLGASAWIPLEDDLRQPRYSFDTKTFADGEYRLRVTASDKTDNPDGEEKSAQFESAIVRIDNSQPSINDLKADVDKSKAVVSFSTGDPGSIIRKAGYRLNAEDMRPVVPVDGAFDQKTETFKFTIDLKDLKRPALLTISVTDEAGNSAIRKVVVE